LNRNETSHKFDCNAFKGEREKGRRGEREKGRKGEGETRGLRD
jgi:hypothetical protein